MKRSAFIFLLLLVTAALAAACAQAAPQPAGPVEEPTAAESENVEQYPADSPAAAPNVSSDYPAPGAAVEAGTGYPEPVNLKQYGPDELPPADISAPEPQSGMASISGTIFSFTSRVIIPETVFYLVRVEGENRVPEILAGPDESKGDVIGRTNAEGKFALDNVPPGNYYLIVWSPYSWSIGADPSQDPPVEQLITVEAGQQLPLGVVQISWP